MTMLMTMDSVTPPLRAVFMENGIPIKTMMAQANGKDNFA